MPEDNTTDGRTTGGCYTVSALRSGATVFGSGPQSSRQHAIGPGFCQDGGFSARHRGEPVRLLCRGSARISSCSWSYRPSPV